jgi:hypothetical protein
LSWNQLGRKQEVSEHTDEEPVAVGGLCFVFRSAECMMVVLELAMDGADETVVAMRGGFFGGLGEGLRQASLSAACYCSCQSAR